MKIFNDPQGSTAWAQQRCGVVTASEVDAIISPKWQSRAGDGVETYMFRKLCEKVLGYAIDGGGTWAMDQGRLLETVAIPWYSFVYGADVQRVGFCLSDDGRIGCSPDGLIGDDCGLEIKSPQPPQHLKYLLKNEVPSDYLAQVHFGMFVTRRPRWIFVSYSNTLPPLVIEVQRDDEIEKRIQTTLDTFFSKFDVLLAKITAMREVENAEHKHQSRGD